MEKIKAYQRKCLSEYKNNINYDGPQSYLGGNTINVLVPVETTVGKVMVVGAYPSARFYTLKNNNGETIRDVPLSDISAPFSDEIYLDGMRVREVLSGQELNNNILNKIGVDRKDCWITNLVKIFLFKKGHVEKYKRLSHNTLKGNRGEFSKYAKNSLQYLKDEIKIAEPYVIILLGAEVTSIVCGIDENDAKQNYMTGEIKESKTINSSCKFICLPHPGILMKRVTKWSGDFDTKISVKAKRNIEFLKRNNKIERNNQ